MVRRLLYTLLTIFLILSFNFVLFRVMPGDPFRIMVPKGADETTRLHYMDHYGLDEPMIVQYFIYLGQTLTGHLGVSISQFPGSDVEDILGPYLTNTLVLAGTGTILSIIVGIYLGRETAWRRGKIADRLGSAFFLVFYCMPTFLFALILLTMFARYIPSWPISGTYSDTYDTLDIAGKLWDRTYHVLLPLFALVIETIATFSIIARSSLIDVLTEEYMVTAVAKGLKGRQVLRSHAMPNAMLPVVTVVAMNVGWIVSGSIMIEIVFSYRGLGVLTYDAVMGRDYPLVQAIFMLETVAVLVANFIADILLFRLDPRVKI
jgi:peptide/nickel transport system permease protein